MAAGRGVVGSFAEPLGDPRSAPGVASSTTSPRNSFGTVNASPGLCSFFHRAAITPYLSTAFGFVYDLQGKLLPRGPAEWSEEGR